LRRRFKLRRITHLEFALRAQELLVPQVPQVPPGLSMVNPQLAEILEGYKNALNAALMATQLLTGGTQSSSDRPSTSAQPRRSESRRTDTLEVCCNLLCRCLFLCSFYTPVLMRRVMGTRTVASSTDVIHSASCSYISFEA